MSGPAVDHLRKLVGMDTFMRDLLRPDTDLFPVSPEQEKAIKAAQDAELAVAQAIARVAATDDGQVLLEWLLDHTLRRPVYVGHLQLSAEQAYAEGRFREGRNAIVHMMLAAIARGRGEQPPTREGIG